MRNEKTYLHPSPVRSIEHCFFTDHLSIHYADLASAIDFALLVEFNGGLDILVLFLGLRLSALAV